MSLPRYDWESEIDELSRRIETANHHFTIKGFADERSLPYFELCRHWAKSPKYKPIVNSKRSGVALIREGNNSFNNISFPQADIRFLQIVKALASPIRFYIVRFLAAGPRSIADFITETQFAYYTSIHAFRHLERMGIIEVCGKTEGYNTYQLVKLEVVRELLASLEALGEKP